MSKFTLVLDSSQVASYLYCPTYWHNAYVKRLTPLNAPETGEAMNAGTYGHELLAIYYRARIDGSCSNVNEAIAKCLAYDPDNDLCECGCRFDVHDTSGFLKDLQECKRCHKCTTFRPHPFALSPEVRTQIQNRFREYVIYWQSREDFIPRSGAHVEIGFSEKLYEDSENLFVIEGRVDGLGSLQGLPCLIDHKFQFKRHYLYNKSIQFKTYAMVTRVPMVVINYVRLHKNFEPGVTLERDIISFNACDLLTWRQRLISVFCKIKHSLETENFAKQWNACSGYGETYKKDEPKYCHYTQLCEQASPDVALRAQETLYRVKEQVWRPW